MANEQQLWTKAPGRYESNRFFESADHMYRRCLDYFKWCDDNPMYKTEQLKKAGPPMVVNGTVIPGETLCELPQKRPYTNKGLCIFLGCNEKYFNTFVAKHKGEKEKEKVADWLHVIDFVKDVIANQQYEGAAAGFFNGNIVGRMIGLADKSEVEVKQETRQIFKIGDKEFEL